jgi:hypothetical protein
MTTQFSFSDGQPLEVIEAITEADVRRFNECLAKEHYLGPRPPTGNSMRQVVTSRGEWVALLMWNAAARRLKPREQWIGWDAAKRASRLKLVAQNSRFLVLSDKRQPNLASAAMGAACRALGAQWRVRYGYAPVLAESFTDPERFKGTCYRASGWFDVGKSAGYGRDYKDYYLDLDHPKVLWLKALTPDAREVLCAARLPEELVSAVTRVQERPLPLNAKLTESLLDAMATVPDNRRCNRSFMIGSMLTIIVLAMMCGERDISGIHRYAQQLKQEQRKRLCLPRNRKHSAIRKAPSYNAFYKLLKHLDLTGLATTLKLWYQAHLDELPPALAMDGKFIGDICGTLNLVSQQDGRPVVSVAIPGKGHEVGAGRAAIREIGDLDGAVVSADALHDNRESAATIIAANGEYFFKIKNNQKTMRTLAEHKHRNLSPLFSTHLSRSRPTDGSLPVELPSIDSSPGSPACSPRRA